MRLAVFLENIWDGCDFCLCLTLFYFIFSGFDRVKKVGTLQSSRFHNYFPIVGVLAVIIMKSNDSHPSPRS